MQFRKELNGGVYLHLKKEMPQEIILGIKEYIHGDTQKKQKYVMKLNLIMIKYMIQYNHMHKMKRCTPCVRCHQKNTYTIYCHACDALVWMDM